MAIATMGVRAALRTVQESTDPKFFNVVDALSTADNRETTGAPKVATVGDSLAAALEKISAWIPSEMLAVWLVLATGFSVFNETNVELVLGGVMVVASGVYAFMACKGAHDRRDLRNNTMKAAKTGFLAAYSFLVYWMAMPGAVATADWKWPGLIPVAVALLTVLFLPQVAQGLKIETITNKPK